MKAGGGTALTFKVAAALVIGVTLGNAGANVMPVFVDDFTARFDMSESSAGLVAAAQLMATAVVTLLLAARAARPGRAGMARTGLGVAALGCLASAAAFDPMTLILASLLLGAGLGAVYASATAALAATDDADKASAVTVSGTVCLTALLIMSVQVLNDSVGEGLGFVLLALCCLPAWFLVGCLPDNPGTRQQADVPSGAVASPRPGPSWVLLGGTALLWAVTQGAWAYASVLGREHTGMSGTVVAAVLAVSSVVALAGAVVGPPAARTFGRMPSMAGFVAVQAVAMGVLVIATEPVLFIIAAVVWQACHLAVLVQMMAAAAVLDPSGRLVASLSGAGALGTGLGPLAVGVILDAAGAVPLGIALALGTFVASLPLLKMTWASAEAAQAADRGAPGTTEAGTTEAGPASAPAERATP
ncbi:MFS transporter [Streptomyces sp. CA-210063]|uniref:MFS transporter n=1 Tax=Streptomyces sp. CA-210063 TaxID=2801029 RepID=UPI00214BF318|nr:MFS transporter [Streptomyces sp. CA-210063]UUU34133.1 MFS transporter [Streptomyces sp. CA-210063]